MGNYLDVPKIFGAKDTGVKLIGDPSTPLKPLCRRLWLRTG